LTLLQSLNTILFHMNFSQLTVDQKIRHFLDIHLLILIEFNVNKLL